MTKLLFLKDNPTPPQHKLKIRENTRQIGDSSGRGFFMYGSVHLKNPCPRIVNSAGILTNFIKNKLFCSAFGITNTRKIENNLFLKYPPKGRAFGALGIRDTKVASGKFLSRNPRKSLLSGNDSCHEISSSWWNGRVLRARAFSFFPSRGRSMIEMLGVLAIIGVLSAGGIMGYNTAMENYHVNQTMDMIAKASSAFPQYLVKSKALSTYNDNTIPTSKLCALNILPLKICNATTANAEHRKGYFGETLLVSVQLSGAKYTSTGHRIFSSDPEIVITKDLIDTTSRIVFNLVDAEIGKSACVKIMTSPVWKGLGTIIYANIYGISGICELPQSMTDAEAACENGIPAGSLFYVYSDGRLIGH